LPVAASSPSLSDLTTRINTEFAAIQKAGIVIVCMIFLASKNLCKGLHRTDQRGRLLSAYVTTGYYDVVVTVEMPNGETMTKYAAAISATGNARTTTVRGYSPEEFSKLAAEAATM